MNSMTSEVIFHVTRNRGIRKEIKELRQDVEQEYDEKLTPKSYGFKQYADAIQDHFETEWSNALASFIDSDIKTGPAFDGIMARALMAVDWRAVAVSTLAKKK